MWSYVVEFIDDENDVVSIIILASSQKTAFELFKKAFPRWEVINIYAIEE